MLIKLELAVALREIQIKSLVSFDGTRWDLLELHRHDSVFPSEFQNIELVEKGASGKQELVEVEKTPGRVDGFRRLHFLFVYCVAYVSSFLKLLCVQSCPMQVAFGIRVL